MIDSSGFFNEFSLREKNGKYGLMDTLTKEIVLDYVFDEIRFLPDGRGECVICLRLNSRWGVIPYRKLHKLRRP